MIVGTAGHIDHGKTTLVRALTGVDTDRLPEEKARGISIELGYAFLDVPGVGGADPAAADAPQRIGFIDVPGHERLVHTMLAGATGIDYALLLVAADDGVMPQTREHLAVLSLLGISRGAVVITKIDRVDAGRVEAVRAEVTALLAPTPLADAEVFAASTQTGEGVAALRAMLFDEARRVSGRSEREGAAFRLAIDRAFTLSGVGTVVTGTVHAGSVNIGDELAVTPSSTGIKARVRSLHAQNASVAQAFAGQRCAVALAGVARDDIARGQWLVAAGSELATSRIDAMLTLWHDEARALRSGTPVHVHIGASDTLGTVAVLHVLPGVSASDAATSGDSLPPGRTAFVQIVLREPVGAWRGDRVVLRDNSSSRTLAGGVVLDPFAPVRYRRTAQRLSELSAWSAPTVRERLSLLIEASPFGVLLARWMLAEGLLPGARPELPTDALVVADKSHGEMVLGGVHAKAASDSAIAALKGFHAREPDAAGPDSARLRRASAPRLPEPLWRALLARLQSQGLITARGAFVHLPEHAVRLSAVDQRIAQKIAPLLDAAGFEGSWARDLARDARESEPLMRTTLARLAQGGELHQVVKDLYYSNKAMQHFAAIIRAMPTPAGQPPRVTAATFRDATSLGRKRAIQLLEYFDRIGLLRRTGDVHRLRDDTTLFSEDIHGGGASLVGRPGFKPGG